MATHIFGVVTADFALLAGCTGLLLVVVAAAGYFPAWRVMRLAPMICLRYE
jgi:ABC-type lipoprotein release transport system permease subunit